MYELGEDGNWLRSSSEHENKVVKVIKEGELRVSIDRDGEVRMWG